MIYKHAAGFHRNYVTEFARLSTSRGVRTNQVNGHAFPLLQGVYSNYVYEVGLAFTGHEVSTITT